jgi:pimeloyl-ACP methyl ester carboxylesterase
MKGRLCFCATLVTMLLTTSPGMGRPPTNVYCFPGVGSDSRIFEKIRLGADYKLVHINYPVPFKNDKMSSYAKRLCDQLDTTQPYILIGVSIGGMLCVELADILKPERVIIISSAKCRQELPFRYRFQKSIPINKLVPKGLMKAGAKILQPLVEPDRKKNKSTFKSMLRAVDKTYLKRSVNMIIHWNRNAYNKCIVHIHGTNDHTLPIRHLTPDFCITKGSHMMTLTRGDEINVLIQTILATRRKCKE